jgi:hypothetical protein
LPGKVKQSMQLRCQSFQFNIFPVVMNKGQIFRSGMVLLLMPELAGMATIKLSSYPGYVGRRLHRFLMVAQIIRSKSLAGVSLFHGLDRWLLFDPSCFAIKFTRLRSTHN